MTEPIIMGKYFRLVKVDERDDQVVVDVYGKQYLTEESAREDLERVSFREHGRVQEVSTVLVRRLL